MSTSAMIYPAPATARNARWAAAQIFCRTKRKLTASSFFSSSLAAPPRLISKQ